MNEFGCEIGERRSNQNKRGPSSEQLMLKRMGWVTLTIFLQEVSLLLHSEEIFSLWREGKQTVKKEEREKNPA